MNKSDFTDLDAQVLMRSQPFRKFLLHIARQAGIWIPTAGAEQSLLFREGQRSLGLDIIRQAARGLPRGTIEQVLVLVLSEANPKETDDERIPERDQFEHQ